MNKRTIIETSNNNNDDNKIPQQQPFTTCLMKYLPINEHTARMNCQKNPIIQQKRKVCLPYQKPKAIHYSRDASDKGSSCVIIQSKGLDEALHRFQY